MKTGYGLRRKDTKELMYCETYLTNDDKLKYFLSTNRDGNLLFVTYDKSALLEVLDDCGSGNCPESSMLGRHNTQDLEIVQVQLLEPIVSPCSDF